MRREEEEVKVTIGVKEAGEGVVADEIGGVLAWLGEDDGSRRQWQQCKGSG